LVPEPADEADHGGRREARVEEDEPRDQIQAICEAVDELRTEGTGDILVFLSGEREIRDTAEAISAMNLRATEILPLYARFPTADPHRVAPPPPAGRLVPAPTSAEPGPPAPGIRYAIARGPPRIPRYSHRLKVQRLPIEPVSQASANQRAGRC